MSLTFYTKKEDKELEKVDLEKTEVEKDIEYMTTKTWTSDNRSQTKPTRQTKLWEW